MYNAGVIKYRADYYPFGIPFSDSSMEEDNILHAGKELEKMHGLYWYDNNKRWYDPVLGRFTTMDPLCEKYYDKNPYAYCGDNPMKYGDMNGDSLTLAGSAEDMQSALNIINNALGGFYTASVNGSGLVSITTVANQQGVMTSEQQAFYSEFGSIVNGTDGMTRVNVVSGDQNVLIGDISTATIDVGDMGTIGSGNSVSESSSFMHEINEQYRTQVLGSSPMRAHVGATRTEGRITGNVYSPERPISGAINGTGTLTVPVRNPATGQWHNVIIHYQNGNVVSVTR